MPINSTYVFTLPLLKGYPTPDASTSTMSAPKGRTWTEEEDAIVKSYLKFASLAQTDPFSRWSEVANRLPGRTGRQVRDRWNNYLNPDLNHEPFSRQDDVTLWKAHQAMGKKWVVISAKVFHSTRSENHVKNRWNSLGFKNFVDEVYGAGAYPDVPNSQKKSKMQPVEVGVKTRLIVQRKPLYLPNTLHVPKSKAVVPLAWINKPVRAAPFIVTHAAMPMPMAMPLAIGPYTSLTKFSNVQPEPEKKRVLVNLARPEKEVAKKRTLKKQKRVNMTRGRLVTWTKEEDEIVSKVVLSTEKNNDLPFTQWSDLVTTKLPGRTGKQVRDRWNNYLNPAINHLPFSPLEDLRLWNAHSELGKKWTEIGVANFHTTRSENQIKNRWHSAAFKKFVRKKFGPSAYENAKDKKRVEAKVFTPIIPADDQFKIKPVIVHEGGKKNPAPIVTTEEGMNDVDDEIPGDSSDSVSANEEESGDDAASLPPISGGSNNTSPLPNKTGPIWL